MYYLFRYLQKATQLDRMLGPAWLAYGHSFAIENEHDQAMAAYFKVGPSPSVTSVLNLSCQACQLMRGCHLPLLYIGLEYSLTNNQQYAERFFSQVITASQGKTRRLCQSFRFYSFSNKSIFSGSGDCSSRSFCASRAWGDGFPVWAVRGGSILLSIISLLFRGDREFLHTNSSRWLRNISEMLS